MKLVGILLIYLILSASAICYGQEIESDNTSVESPNLKQLYGFVRGGLYAGIDHADKNKPYVSSAFSDFGLKVDLENRLNFRAFADLRFRYGAELQKPVNNFDLHEAFITVNGKKWELSTGQKIVKWGRADYTNPTSKL